VTGVLRLALFFSIMAWCYSYINLLIPASAPVRFFAAILFGLFQSLCLLHQMHDAGHSAIGYTPLWWNIMGRLVMDWMAGASMVSWHHQHIIGHHIYTNIMGADPDMPYTQEGDLRYLVKRQFWKKIYKFQHLYMPILYGGLAFKFRIQDFTWTFFSEVNGPIHVNPIPKSEWINLILAKSFWIFYRVIFPIYFLGVSMSSILFLFFISELVTGYFLAFNFQVSHISTETHFPCDAQIEPSLKEEWAVLQVITSVDYGHGSFLQTFLSGALNYQTIHHLFPGVSQYHYPSIAPIVIDVCKKYKIPFNILPSFVDALWAHLNYLYQMGNRIKDEKPTELQK